jgi:hypothetical protein
MKAEGSSLFKKLHSNIKQMHDALTAQVIKANQDLKGRSFVITVSGHESSRADGGAVPKPRLSAAAKPPVRAAGLVVALLLLHLLLLLLLLRLLPTLQLLPLVLVVSQFFIGLLKGEEGLG